MEREDYIKEIEALRRPALEPVVLQADPEPLQIDLKRLAIIHVDMENAFATKGGFFDLMGWDLTECQKILGPIGKVNDAARAKGIKIIYIAHQFAKDLSDSGGPDSGHWHKDLPLTLYREHPEWQNQLLKEGTWGCQIVDELKPQEGDIVLPKSRYSSFYNTSLDFVLQTYNIKYLAFTGIATNICVESTIRDALFRGYFPILIKDCAAAAGPPFMQDAVIHNMTICFGWITTSEKIIKAMQAKKSGG